MTLETCPVCMKDYPLDALNTLGLPAVAERFFEVRSVPQLQALIRSGALHAQSVLVLGGGSNVVLASGRVACVLKIQIAGRRYLGQSNGGHLVEAGAGEVWHDFVLWTLQQGRPGLENLSLIPGSVGAAPIQNIGAYGLELTERFHSLVAVSLEDGSVREFSREECQFAYRDSVFKQGEAGRWVIVSVTCALPVAWKPNLDYAELARELAGKGIAHPDALQVSDAVVAIRRRKLPDPAQLGNVGSFFKNPVVDAQTLARLLQLYPQLPNYPMPHGCAKLAAGWLIDQCGWKGRDLGPVGCYENQALVLVNRGGAVGADIEKLARMIVTGVEARFGVKLEAEPRFVWA